MAPVPATVSEEWRECSASYAQILLHGERAILEDRRLLSLGINAGDAAVDHADVGSLLQSRDMLELDPSFLGVLSVGQGKRAADEMDFLAEKQRPGRVSLVPPRFIYLIS